MTSPEANFALECRNVSVNYGDLAALAGVSVAFAPRLIHAVVGQNGAGKTTFARVAAGIVRPDEGAIEIDGRSVPTGSVHQARAAGVELVHQSFALPPSFTVAEAMEYGSDRPGRIFTRRGLEARWARHLQSLGVRVRLGDRIRDLPVEVQQGVEIARALVTEAKVLILDEPTAVLAPAGIETLFERLRRLRENGVTIILILHKIREVLAVADTVTVLRGGRLVEGPLPASRTDGRRLAASIIGSGGGEVAELSGGDRAALVGAADQPATAAPRRMEPAAPVLELADVSTRADAEGPALDHVALTVGRGEIVGIAGVEGNGQRTLVRALADLTALTSGRIALAGADVTRTPLSARRASGLRVIPFERNSEGLSLSSALWENWSVPRLLAAGALSLIDPAALRKGCRGTLEQWDVRFSSTAQYARSLSGGNAQKLILAREVDAEASLIIAAQPTRGLDVGATAFVWRSLREARARGCGVLLISSDLDELFDISDRILVMLSGRIAGTFRPPYHLAEIGAAMTGAGR
ncbi:MAG: ATP-binding cassette domain-containing protein [Methylobacteriaceae bacterium]|nr:ATP-binding cassette domain-containing protein [Methylobacteriaceae bacterium]MBV9246998.1 ATP-binding cassette domain-containing protein [Methylobacteriaceae bacterium]